MDAVFGKCLSVVKIGYSNCGRELNWKQLLCVKDCLSDERHIIQIENRYLAEYID